MFGVFESRLWPCCNPEFVMAPVSALMMDMKFLVVVTISGSWRGKYGPETVENLEQNWSTVPLVFRLVVVH